VRKVGHQWSPSHKRGKEKRKKAGRTRRSGWVSERDMESTCTGNGIDVDGDKTSCWLSGCLCTRAS
jgi:hypothetical protein